MYSMAQGGNLGQLISVILLVVGYTKDSAEAEATANAVLVTLGLVGYAISLVVSWVGRWRKGDLHLSGFRKEA